MPNYNRVILIGHLARDPEQVKTVCRVTIAVSERWRDKVTQEKKESVSFIDCTAFSKTAELMMQYTHKGDPVMIEGRLRQDKWTDKEGKNRTKLSVAIDRLEFLKRKQESQPETKEPKITMKEDDIPW